MSSAAGAIAFQNNPSRIKLRLLNCCSKYFFKTGFCVFVRTKAENFPLGVILISLLCIILKSRKVFSNETLLSLYHTFVYPYLSYSIHVWGKAYNTHLNDLIALQNKAMRIINGVPPRTNMDNFYIEMNILTVKHIFNYHIGLFMFKYVNNMTPDVFDNFFRNVSDIHQHNTRNATQNLLYATFRGTTRGQQTFKYRGPHIWNFIIKNINPNCPIGSFKEHSRQLLLAIGDDIM